MDPKYLDLLFGQDATGTGITEMTVEYFRRGFRFLGDEPPTDGDFTWLIQQCMIRARLGMVGQWKAAETVAVGYVRYPNNLEAYNIMLICTTAGTTGNIEPTWPIIGESITDGSAIWKVASAVPSEGDFVPLSGNVAMTGPLFVPSPDITDDSTRVATTEFVQALVGDGIPLGTPIFSLAQNPPEGYIRALGGEWNREGLLSELWQWAQDNDLVKSEAEWQVIKAANNSCPFYSEGTTANTFRVPYIIDIFRPIDSVSGDRTVGDVQGDAIRNFTGEVRSGLATYSGETGATGVYADSYAPGSANLSYTSGSARALFARLDPSLVVPTAEENRMRNIGVNCYIKAYGAVTNVGDAELEEIKNDVDLHATQIAALQERVAVETWSDGTNWYRIYSDGWCEQGGRVSGVTNNQSVTFLLEFIAAPVLLVSKSLTAATATDGVPGAYNLTAISFQIQWTANSTAKEISWEAKGYIGGN